MNNKTSASRWVREIIQQQDSYHVPPAGDFIKLDAMENPWPMPESLRQPWLDSLAVLQLNRYPDPAAGRLVKRLRDHMSIPAESSIMLGNGSDELIQAILMAVSGEGHTVLAPAPSFVMYEVLARACGLTYAGVPLRSDFTLDMTAMREAINRHQPAVIFLASPNNPTAAAFQPAEIEEILDLAPGLVVVDEAYQPFVRTGGENFISRMADHPDLIVMRTLSKVGLAGIRLGLIAGHADWISQLDKLRLPYNINSLTQATASFALDHWQAFQDQIDEICTERDRVYDALSSIEGIKTWPSDTNFILFRVSGKRADKIHAELLEKGILIKCLHRSGGALENCLRVTIGSLDENDTFLDEMSVLLMS
ncbi:MAG: histidinol-phosphate transaminase [Pseudomonadota bacterium]|nr:histidinol-phosphate transaminase [Pseudomonadota bacterium]